MPEEFDEWLPWEQMKWGRGGSPAYVTHFEMEAWIDPIGKRQDLLKLKLDSIEDRLVEERAKHLFVDLFTTLLGRGLILVLAAVTAIVAARFYGFP